MAEYGSGIFYGRSKSIQNLTNISQLGILSLPPELDVGPPLTPQTLKDENDIPKDIILLAEFSEIEGPIPLLSIPLNYTKGLDLNDFVLQLMSTDYQSLGKSDFQIHKDTCLLQEDPEKGHNTYVHYFTLYDVRARGFVRPMCLAYISWEPEKLKKYFKSIQKEFYKATEYLLVTNLQIFSEEIKNRIQDLHFTKERYIQSHQQFEKGEIKVNTPDFEKKKSELNEDSHVSSNAAGHSRPHFFKNMKLREEKRKSKPNIELVQENRNISSYERLYENRIPYLGFSQPQRIRTVSENFDPYSKNIPLSSSLPLNPSADYSASTGSLKLASLLRSHFNSTPSPSHEELTSNKESLRETLMENLSFSSDSSSSTLTSSKPLKSPRNRIQASSLMHDHSLNEVLNNSEEMSILQHTSLEALAVQLLDCQHILEVIKHFLEKSEVCKEMNDFLNEIKKRPLTPLYATMEELGLLDGASESQKEPSIFVISLMRRNFKNIRTIRILCGSGYIACIAHLVSVYHKFSKPTLTLLFEDLDRQLYENPYSSLFIGNIPAISVGVDRNSAYFVPPAENFSLLDSCWDEEFLNLLRVDLSKATTPDSEYSDAKEMVSRDDVAVADDCLEVFTQVSGTGSEKDKAPQVGDESSDQDAERYRTFKSSGVYIKDSSHHSTPIRSTSSESSWASSTSRDINFLDITDNEVEGEGEEEEAFMSLTDQNIIRITQHDIDKRMSAAKVYRTSALIQQFSGVSQCIVHSVLSGKPMILAGPENLKLVVILYAKSLSTILPVKPNEFLPVLKWHTGTITPHHLSLYKIIGTCIPERLHVQDLMSNATLNRVTVLNIETGHISGVSYSGNLIHKADQLSRRNFRSDLSLQVALQSILVSLGMKVFLYFHLKRTTNRTSNEILKAIWVPRGDWGMVQYLSSVVEEQMQQLGNC